MCIRDSFRVVRPVQQVTVEEKEVDRPGEVKYQVALWDFGAKHNIVQELLNRGCEVTSFPATATAKEILVARPDGIMLSNGPGNPEDNPEIIAQLAKLYEARIPMFGICLGHQPVSYTHLDVYKRQA